MNVISIALFTYVVTINQAELVSENTHFQSEKLISSVVQNLRRNPALRSQDATTAEGKNRLIDQLSQTIGKFAPSHIIYSGGGAILKQQGDLELPPSHAQDASRARALRDFSGADFHLAPHNNQQEMRFFIPLDEFGLFNTTAYLQLDMHTIGQRFRELYRLIGINILAITVLHILFALLIYRMIINPIVQLSHATERLAAGDYEHKVEVVRNDELGSLAYGFNRMVDVIRAYIESLQNGMEEQRKAKELMERMAITDELTGLHNRHHLYRTLEYQINMANRYKQPLCLILLDVDHFKKVNDNYGHSAGDEVLKQLANLLRNSVRDTDFLARYGGEEIIVVLPNTDIHGAVITAQKIRMLLEQLPIHIADGQTITVTASFGVAELSSVQTDAEDKAPITALINGADEALYKAKEEGRNRVLVFRRGNLP